MYYRPMFGAFGSALPKSSITFVSRAAYDDNIGEKLGLQRNISPVSGTRTLGKRHMVRNDYLPNIDVNPETFAVTIDGKHVTVEPPATISLNQLYFFS
jgi:urease subunit alpha